jgi:hypothetical protein
MVFSLLSSIFALFIFFQFPLEQHTLPYLPLFFLSIMTLLFANYTSYKKGEAKLLKKNPLIARHLNKKIEYRLESFLASSLLFISFCATSDALFTFFLPQNIYFALHALLFGGFLDIFCIGQNRVRCYLDPFFTLDQLVKQANKEISASKDFAFLDTISAILEMATLATEKNWVNLAQSALTTLPPLFKNYLNMMESIAHEDPKKSMSDAQEIHYVYDQISQRVHVLFMLALKNSLEPILNSLHTTLGKIALASAHMDFALANMALQDLKQIAQTSQKEGFMHVSERSEITLVEVSKKLLEYKNLPYSEIKESFLTIIETLETLAEGNYRFDKERNIQFLLEPIKQLRRSFEKEPAKSHQDTPLLLARMAQTIGQFTELEKLLLATPPGARFTAPASS